MHRSLRQLAVGLTALTRCAIPQEMDTPDRVAKSLNIISVLTARVAPMCDIGVGRAWGAAPVVSLLFIDSERSCLGGGRTRDGL